MISGKSSKLSDLLKGSAFVALALMAFASESHAQNTGYSPPPMFEDMTPPMVRPESKDGNIVPKMESVDPQLPPPTIDRPPVVAPRVSINPDMPRPAPVEPIAPDAPSRPVVPAFDAPATTAPVAPAPVTPTPPKMMQPIIEAPKVKREKPAAEKKEIKSPVPPEKPSAPEKKADVPPQPAPIAPESNIQDEMPLPTPAPAPAPAPVVTTPESKKSSSGNTVTKPAASNEESRINPTGRDPSVSAIQGPKTMPALPTQNVDGQVTFDAKPPVEEPTILERQQDAAKKSEILEPIVPRPKDGVAPASFEGGEKGALKKIIPYNPGQIGLDAKDADPIAAGVVKELDDEEKAAWRVQIKSYATPHGNGLSSDRRIALSRALSLRSTLIAQGVGAAKIDVLAEGLQSDNKGPPDRIDLYLYEPKQE